MKSLTRKIFSVLVIVCMTITLVPTLSGAGLAYGEEVNVETRTLPLDLTYVAESSETPDWQVGCIQNGSTWINDAQGWTWNASSHILTLDGINFELDVIEYGYNVRAIQLPANSTVIIKGENHISCTGDTYCGDGIVTKGDTSFLGNGSLEINIGCGSSSAGMHCWSNEGEPYQVTIGDNQNAPQIYINMLRETGSIKSVTVESGNLVVANGTYKVKVVDNQSSSLYAIRADEITVGEKGILDVECGAAGNVYAIMCVNMSVAGQVKIKTGKGKESASGMYCEEGNGLVLTGNGRIEYTGVPLDEPVSVLGLAAESTNRPIALVEYCIVPSQNFYISGGTIERALLYEVAHSTIILQKGTEPVIISAKPIESAPFAVKANLTTKFSKVGGYNDVKVTWTKHSKATAYKIYYNKGTATKYTYLTKVTGTSFSKKDLAAGAKYTFKVVPVKGNTTYGYKTATVYTLKKLAAPTVTRSGTKVKVKWTNIEGETGYQISKSTSKTGTNIVYTYATTKGTYKVLKATKGKTYYYKVRAYKTVGTTKIYGPWSPVKAFKR